MKDRFWLSRWTLYRRSSSLSIVGHSMCIRAVSSYLRLRNIVLEDISLVRVLFRVILLRSVIWAMIWNLINKYTKITVIMILITIQIIIITIIILIINIIIR